MRIEFKNNQNQFLIIKFNKKADTKIGLDNHIKQNIQKNRLDLEQNPRIKKRNKKDKNQEIRKHIRFYKKT